MSDLHVDDFCRDATKILMLLYAYFPRKTTVHVEDISGPDTPDEFGLHSKRHESCLGAMLWLSENGYLTFGQTIRQEAIDEAALSHRAFVLLTAYDTDPPVEFLAADGDVPTATMTIEEIDDASAIPTHEPLETPPLSAKPSTCLRRIDMLRHALRFETSDTLKALFLHYMSSFQQ